MTLTAPTIPDVEKNHDGRVRERVDLVMRNAAHRWGGEEQRGDRRIPFPYPIYLTPCDSVGIATGEPTQVVLGRHLAERGLDFYHKEPLPHRYVIASFEYGEGRWVSLLLVLNWCRFNQAGWYDTGGKFVKLVGSPAADELSGAKWEAVTKPPGNGMSS